MADRQFSRFMQAFLDHVAASAPPGHPARGSQCLSFAQALQLARGEVHPSLAPRLTGHLNTCRYCRALMANLRAELQTADPGILGDWERTKVAAMEMWQRTKEGALRLIAPVDVYIPEGGGVQFEPAPALRGLTAVAGETQMDVPIVLPQGRVGVELAFERVGEDPTVTVKVGPTALGDSSSSQQFHIAFRDSSGALKRTAVMSPGDELALPYVGAGHYVMALEVPDAELACEIPIVIHPLT